MLRHSNSPTSEEKLMAYIYDDVDDSDIFTFKSLQDNSNSGDDKVVSSEQQLELINENNELKAKVKILEDKANLLELRISEIYKTAKAEIERKDRRIRELNQEKDDVLFRRNRSANQYHKGANDVYHHNPTTYQAPEVNCKLHDKDKEVKVGSVLKARLEKPISISSSKSEREIEENRGLTTKNISMIPSALPSKLSEEITKPEVATESVNQQTSEENSSHPSPFESRKDEKSDSSDIIIIDDSEEGDSGKSKTDGIDTFTDCRVVVSKSEQKLVNNHIDAQSIKEKRPAARITRSKSDYQPRHVRTPSPDRVKSPVFEKTLKRDTKNDNQTLDCRLPARTRSEHQRRLRRTPSPHSNKLPRTPPESPPRSRAVLPKSLKRPTSNSPSRRKTYRLIYSSPPKRAISPYNSKRTKSSVRANNSPSRRARSRSPPRSFRDRGRPRSFDRKRWMTDENRRRSRSRGNDTREHQHRRERERSRHEEETVKARNLKVDRHGNAIETYRDWKNKKLQEQTTKIKEDEIKMSADQELADLFREGGGSETPLFGSETGSNFDDIQSDDEFDTVCSTNIKGKGDEATECRTALNTSDLSEAELERMLQIKLKELNSSSLHSEIETSNVSPTNDFVRISQKQEECRKSSSFSDNDLRTKLSKKRKKSEDTNNQNVVDQNKNDEEEKRLYGVNNGATKTQSIYGSIIEEVQKIRVRESRLLKNSVTDSTKIKTSNIIQIEESNPVEKNKKKIGIDDYKKRNEGKHSADDIQQEPTDQKPHLTHLTKETLPVSPATEKIDNTDTLPDKPSQRIRIIENRVVTCAKTVVQQTTEADLVKSVQTESKQDIEIDIEVESNSLPGSGQDKGSFLNDFDFSLSEDEFIEKNVEKKSAIGLQDSMDENKLNGQVEQNITQESRSENVSQKVEKESSVIQSSSRQIATNDDENLKTAPTLKEPKEQESNEPETECIENIQEAIHKSTLNPEPATIIRTAQLNTEELQKCLEDDDDSVAKSNDAKPKTVREQIISLFGSDSPVTPEIKKETKPRKTEAQKACRNLTNLGEDSTKFINAKVKKTENESFRVRDKTFKTKEVPETTQLKSEEKQSETTCPVFCNNPNYIPVSPNSHKQLADYIEKHKKDQPDKEENKKEDNEEESLDETSTNDEKKSSKVYKRKPFKVKMPFPNQESKKQSNDSKKRKRPAKPKTKNPKITEPEDDSFTTTIKNIVEAEKRKCTKPKKKKSSKKLEQTDPTLPAPCDEVKCNDSLKEKSLKRITPIKVGEVSGDILITSNKRKLINTEEQRPEKIQKIETGASQTSNQSPLPHMEEMLKHLEQKTTPPTLIVKQKTSYVYTNIHNSTKLPKVSSSVADLNPLESLLDNTINQIHLDSKDVSMLGANERVIFDNIHEYLGDKSLATFDTVDKTLNVHNKIKECSSHFDFSNMLHKSVTTSTPLKQDGLATSKTTKTYLTSPLKRDKRRRIAIKVVDLPKT